MISSSDDILKQFTSIYGNDKYNVWLIARMIQVSCITIGPENVKRLTKDCSNYETAIKKVFANIISVYQSYNTWSTDETMDVFIELFKENKKYRLDIGAIRKKHIKIVQITSNIMNKIERNKFISGVINAIEGVEVKNGLRTLSNSGKEL